jgi:hypothetical protein
MPNDTRPLVLPGINSCRVFSKRESLPRREEKKRKLGKVVGACIEITLMRTVSSVPYHQSANREMEAVESGQKIRSSSGSSFLSCCLGGGGTYQRVINGEAKSCRHRAKRCSHGYNPVNFRTGVALPPVQCRARKAVVRCFARRDRVHRNQLLFRGLLRPSYAAATQ